MRILTVCSSYRVFGAETITLRMLEGFKQKGHEQVAVTSVWTDGEFSRRLSTVGISEVRLALGAITVRLTPRYLWWMANTITRLPGAWFRWWTLLREFQPDAIVLTSSRQALLLYPWLARYPSYLIEFTNVIPNQTNRRIYDFIGKKLARFVAVSEFMGRHLAEIGAPPDKIAVVKSGAFFACERMQVERIHARSETGTPSFVNLGIVGQIAPNKGHDSLVDAVQILRRRGVECSVSVYGTGGESYVSQLRARIAERDLTKCWRWMGYETDKAKIFSSFDICLVPSCFGDPFPTVAMEAAAYALPVIAARSGGLPEIVVDGLTGVLVDSNNAEQLAVAIHTLSQSPHRRREMGLAGRRRVFENFTVEKMVAEFEALLMSSAPSTTKAD